MAQCRTQSEYQVSISWSWCCVCCFLPVALSSALALSLLQAPHPLWSLLPGALWGGWRRWEPLEERLLRLSSRSSPSGTLWTLKAESSWESWGGEGCWSLRTFQGLPGPVPAGERTPVQAHTQPWSQSWGGWSSKQRGEGVKCSTDKSRGRRSGKMATDHRYLALETLPHPSGGSLLLYRGRAHPSPPCFHGPAPEKGGLLHTRVLRSLPSKRPQPFLHTP